jgi:hypothetical protein
MMKQVVSSIIVGGYLLIVGGSGPAGAFPETSVTEKKGGNSILGIFQDDLFRNNALLSKTLTAAIKGSPTFTSDLEGNPEVNDVLEVHWRDDCEPPGCTAQGEKGQVVQKGYDFPGGVNIELGLIKFEDADTGTTSPLHISDQLALWQDSKFLSSTTHFAMTFTSDCDATRAPSPLALQSQTCDLAAPSPPPPSIPEPSTLALIMIGLVGYAWRQRKKMTTIQC